MSTLNFSFIGLLIQQRDTSLLVFDAALILTACFVYKIFIPYP